MKNSYRILVTGAVLMSCAIALIAQRGGGPLQRDPIPAGSRVQYKSFHSALVNRDLNYAIYLPPSYETSTKKVSRSVLPPWPERKRDALEHSRRSRCGPRQNDSRRKIRRVHRRHSRRRLQSFYTNARGGGAPWEDVVVKEFIPMVESTYRVNATRATRAISGISMGGYGSLKIAMKHPEMFSAVSAHSAALVPSFDSYDCQWPAPGRVQGDL